MKEIKYNLKCHSGTKTTRKTNAGGLILAPTGGLILAYGGGRVILKEQLRQDKF
jgi:hypothetical protein